MFHESQRTLQDKFDTRQLADRLQEPITQPGIGPEDPAAAINRH